MIYEVTMPKLGLTMTSGVAYDFNIKIGDYVKKGDELLTVETDKITSIVESQEDGYVVDILAVEGNEYAVSEVLCVISDEKELSYNKAKTTNMVEKKVDVIENIPVVKLADEKTDRIFITPIARKLAKENNIDIKSLSRKHNEFRLVKKDVLEAIENKNVLAEQTKVNVEVKGQVKETKLAGTRKVIAERLSFSKQNIPHAYFKVEVNCDSLLDVRKQMMKSVLRNTGLKLTINDLIVKAVINALSDYKELNSNLNDDTLYQFDDINIGIAMDVDTGLIVPNIKKANDLTITEIKKQINELYNKAKESSLSLEEITGGTFTISNLGAYKVKEFSAIVNPPEVGILAVSSISKNACVVDDELKIANTMVLNLSVDHRVIDGALACQFLNAVKYNLENPFMLLS